MKMGTSVVSHYIDKIFEDAKMACLRLEENGIESLMVTVGGGGHVLLGSHKGRAFLKDRHIFVKEFIQSCLSYEDGRELKEPQVKGLIDEQIPSVEHQMPSVQQQIPSVEHQMASVEQQMASVQQQMASVQQQMASVKQQTASVEQHPSTDVLAANKTDFVSYPETIEPPEIPDSNLFDDNDVYEGPQMFSDSLLESLAAIPYNEIENSINGNTQTIGMDSGFNESFTETSTSKHETDMSNTVETLKETHSGICSKTDYHGENHHDNLSFYKCVQNETQDFGVSNFSVDSLEQLANQIIVSSEPDISETTKIKEKPDNEKTVVQGSGHIEIKETPSNICSQTNYQGAFVHVKKETQDYGLSNFSVNSLEDVSNQSTCIILPEHGVNETNGFKEKLLKDEKPVSGASNNTVRKTISSILECDICGKRLSSKKKLKGHKQSYHSNENSFECRVCGIKFKHKGLLTNHEKSHERQNHRCEICNKEFPYLSVLKVHMVCHTNEKAFACEICGQAFRTKQRLLAHNRHHTGEKPFKCDVEGCEKVFRTWEARKLHQSCHSKTYTFICDICGKQFKQNNYLRQHRKSHKEPTIWPCEYCGEKFKTCLRYKNHIVNVHVEKKDEVALKRKIKFYSCDICKKVFGEKKEFNQHTNIHFGLKPFKCVQCEKCFSSKSNLLQHVKIHMGGKRFKCSYCSKTYSEPKMLTLHLRLKHKTVVDESHDSDSGSETSEEFPFGDIQTHGQELQIISDEIYQMKQPDKITPKPPEQILCDEEYIATPIIGNEILNINHDFEFDTIQNFF